MTSRKTRIRSIYRIPDVSDAPASARRIATRELAGSKQPELVESVSLLLGEVMAERISRNSQARSRLTVDVRRSRDRDRWCVIDRGRPTLPRGLRSTALDEIADAWGVSRQSGLTRTWFELTNEA